MVQWFNGLSFQMKILVIVIIVIIIWLLWRKYGYKLEQLTQARDIQVLPGEVVKLTSIQQSNIKDIGQVIENDINDTPITGHVYDGYTKALALTDTELFFLADYYKKYLGNGTSLWRDIDSQYYITDGRPAKLQTRLDAIGKK